MSSVFYKLEAALQVGTDNLGLLGSLFFISYAVGQLINGFVGDRISPSKFVAIATFATAALNLTIGLCGNYTIILVCWTLNGFVQSIFWGPLMRMLAQKFDKSGNVNIATGMSTSMIIGFILSWSVLGRILMDSGWQLYFYIPAAVAFPVFGLWAILSTSEKRAPSPSTHRTLGIHALYTQIRSEKLWLVAAICVCQGVIKESVSLWAPIMLTQTLGIDVKSSFSLILIIPIANLGGILLSKALANRFSNRITTALIIHFAIAVLCSLALVIFSLHSLLAVILVASVSATIYGANSILLSIIPLSFAHRNIVSTLAGIFDFSSYVGAAISSFALGFILSGGSIRPITLIWSFTGMAAALLCGLYGRALKPARLERVDMLSQAGQ